MKNKSYLLNQQQEIGSKNYDFRVINLGKFISSKLPVKTGKLLDVGFGNGLILNFFSKNGFKVTGMEISKPLTQQLKKNKSLRGIRIINADIAKRKGNSNFDVVIAMDIIEHIKNDKLAMHNLYSFVKPNGFLIITVPAHGFLFGKRDKALGHFRRYDKKRLQSLAKNLDGKIKHLGYWNILGFFTYFLYEKILRKSINEDFRERYYQSSVFKFLIEAELKIEQKLNSSPLGLTLIMILQKI